MLHLNTGVHFNEVVVALIVHQELHGAGVDKADLLGDLHGVGAQFVAHLLGHGEGGRELHHLLEAALQGAVALMQVHHIAVLVGQDLHLDMLGALQELFNEDAVVAEGLGGLALDQIERGDDFLFLIAAAHTAAAAAGGCLEHDGEAVLLCLGQGLLSVLQRFGAAGNDGHAAADGRFLGGQLVAHLGQHMGGRADKHDAVLLAGAGKLRVFRQKAVAGVDGVHMAALGQIDDGGNVQIGTQGAQLLIHLIGFVRLGTEQAVGIFFGIHGHGAQIQISAGAEHTDGDLAAVGDQDLFDRMFGHSIVPFF